MLLLLLIDVILKIYSLTVYITKKLRRVQVEELLLQEERKQNYTYPYMQFLHNLNVHALNAKLVQLKIVLKLFTAKF